MFLSSIPTQSVPWPLLLCLLSPPRLIDGGEAYSIRHLLDVHRRGWELQYLVDWEGYGLEECFWVSARLILNPSLIANLHHRWSEGAGPTAGCWSLEMVIVMD